MVSWSPGPIRSSLLPPVHTSSHQDGGHQLLWRLGPCPTGSPPCPPWAAALLPAGCALPTARGHGHVSPSLASPPCWAVGHRKGSFCAPLPPATAGQRCRQRAPACERWPICSENQFGPKRRQRPSRSSVPPQAWPQGGTSALAWRGIHPGRDTCTDPAPHCGPWGPSLQMKAGPPSAQGPDASGYKPESDHCVVKTRGPVVTGAVTAQSRGCGLCVGRAEWGCLPGCRAQHRPWVNVLWGHSCGPCTFSVAICSGPGTVLNHESGEMGPVTVLAQGN